MKCFPNIALLFIAILAVSLTSCASMDASKTESSLSSAGFQVKTPENATQQEIYDALPSYKLQRGEYMGKVFYAYKDDKQGVAYVGDENAYEQYQAIAIQQQLAEDYRRVTMMNERNAASWYRAYY